MTLENTQTNNKLAQSQFIHQNPHASTIQQLKNIIPVLQKQLQSLRSKHAQLLKSIASNNQYQQNTNHEPQPFNIKNTQSHNHKPQQKTLTQISHAIHHKSKHLQKSILRLQLLQLGSNLGILSSSRINQLQKIFNHYCHYIFKSGKHVTFDRIQYQKQHLIMERFFAFIHDFHLNKFHDPLKPSKQLIPKHQLILIFKKSASNSRNLQFPQFITSLQRFALLRYDYEETYDERKQKQQKQRRRIKQINLRRQKQRQRKRKQKEQQQQRQKLQQQQRLEQQEKRLKQEQMSNQLNNESQEPREQTKQQRKQRKKREKQKKKKKKSQVQERQHQKQNNQEGNNKINDNGENNHNQQNENNDNLLNQMMKKDNLLTNPNQEFNHLEKFKKLSQDKNISKNAQNNNERNQNELFSLSKQQKIQLLFRIIQLDDPKAVQAKLREYEKPLFKQSAQLRKSSLQESNFVPRLKQTDAKNQIRLGELKSKLNDRKKQQFKLNVSRSITDQKYSQKRKDDYEKYLNKSLAASNHDLTSLLMKRNQLRSKNQEQTISLNMLNQASERELNNLKLGNNIKKFIQAQDEDSVFLKQYGELDKVRSSNSSYISKTPRYSVDLKQRVNKMQEQQKRQEQQKLQRFALQMYKNQHYMKRFLQRKH